MPNELQKTDKQIRDEIVSKAMAKIRDPKSPTKPPRKDLVIEARELLAKATPGPWAQTQVRMTTTGRQYIEIEHRNSDCVSDMICQIDSDYLCAADLNETDHANANLIARAPELLRQLCDEVEALRKHVADLNHDLEATIKHSDEVYRRMMNDNA